MPSTTAKTPGLLSTWPVVEEFIFAGNATFTLRSTKTGARFTYIVRVKKEDLRRFEAERRLVDTARRNGTLLDFRPDMTGDQVTYFVNLLRGPDNTADFAYMGVLRRDPARFFWTAASGRVGRGAPAFKALMWMLDVMANKHPNVSGSSLEVWHEGRCGACGRKLTVPESIAAGLGPECAGRMRLAA